MNKPTPSATTKTDIELDELIAYVAPQLIVGQGLVLKEGIKKYTKEAVIKELERALMVVRYRRAEKPNDIYIELNARLKQLKGGIDADQ